MDNNLGKNMLIAGCTSGIGLEYVLRHGAVRDNQIVMIGRNQEKLEEVQKRLACTSHIICYDFEDIQNISQIFEQIKQWNIQFDSLIYCVGMDDTSPIKVVNETRANNMMNVNALSFLFLCKQFYKKKYSKDGASIVAISSLAAVRAEEGMALYSASKAALNSFIRIMAKEFCRRNIRVNGIMPAGVDTPMAERKGALLDGVSDGSNKGGQPYGLIPTNTIVDQIDFLLGEASAYTTGTILEINAGMI